MSEQAGSREAERKQRQVTWNKRWCKTDWVWLDKISLGLQVKWDVQRLNFAYLRLISVCPTCEIFL